MRNVIFYSTLFWVVQGRTVMLWSPLFLSCCCCKNELQIKKYNCLLTVWKTDSDCGCSYMLKVGISFQSAKQPSLSSWSNVLYCAAICWTEKLAGFELNDKRRSYPRIKAVKNTCFLAEKKKSPTLRLAMRPLWLFFADHIHRKEEKDTLESPTPSILITT